MGARTSRIIHLLLSSWLLLPACGEPATLPDLPSPPRDMAMPKVQEDLRAPPDLTGSCAADNDCGGGTPSCCGSACVNLMSDVLHCGACGMACAAGRSCCAGRCVYLDNDVAHCGGCGRGCQIPNGTPSCNKGACVIGACDPGWSDCAGGHADGCETPSGMDVRNCGGCGVVCSVPHGTPGCSGGKCELVSCDQGYDDCNADGSDGCEIRLENDANHCGACGADCSSRPNAQVMCGAGACTIRSCSQGYLDCDSKPETGCEVDSRVNLMNCGACGNACPKNTVCAAGMCTCPPCKFPGVAASSCQNLMCVIDACFNGYLDCDQLVQNGCEAQVATDAKNCGGCGMACPQNAPYCQAGVCTSIGPSCLDALKSNPNAKSGVYTIDPDGGGPITPYPVYCDMTTDGGGWTAFFAGINGSPNVFNRFEDTAVDCNDPSNRCLRRLPPNVNQGSQFMATCGGASLRFNVNGATFIYFSTGVQGGSWMPNANQVAVAGNANPAYAMNTWTGSGANKGWIISAGDAMQPRTFASSYNQNAQWDWCNGVQDIVSPIRLYYR